MKTLILTLVVMVGCVGDAPDGTPELAGTGGVTAPELAGIGGAAAPALAGTGGAAAPAPSSNAPATAACPNPVAGPACADAYGYVYLPGDVQHWCVQCYDWPLPPADATVSSKDRPIYRSGCQGTSADVPSLIFECVTDCGGCAGLR